MKAAICSGVLTGIILASQPAIAGQHHGRYQIVQASLSRERADAGKIFMLDRLTGTLWTWSEKQGTSYAGILAANQPGSFARIIRVAW